MTHSLMVDTEEQRRLLSSGAVAAARTSGEGGVPARPGGELINQQVSEHHGTKASMERQREEREGSRRRLAMVRAYAVTMAAAARKKTARG